jgi:hypothetical protein
MRNFRRSVELRAENLLPSLPMTPRLALAGVGLALSIACAGPQNGSLLLGGEEEEESVGGAAGTNGGMPSLGTGGSIGEGPDLNLGGDFSSDGGGGGRVGNGMPELCDGLDNDANGIIDDVDVGHDGVCDCLSIATIGQIGPWSTGGNIFVSWLEARSPQAAVALDDQVLTPELLAPFQVIVFLHAGTASLEWAGNTTPAHHAFSEAESATFKSWVEAGGGAMTTIGYSSDEASEVQNINLMLNPVGLGYSAERINLNGYIQNWESHPVTAGVSNIKTNDGVEPESAGATLAHGPGDEVALQVAEVQNGRIVVWGDEWITYDSEWRDVEDQQVERFWLNILKWLTPPNECQVEIPPSVH